MHRLRQRLVHPRLVRLTPRRTRPQPSLGQASRLLVFSSSRLLPYTELHCHSVFSLLDGASEPEALVARAKALGMPALALTDHDDLGGAVRFAQAAREAGIGGILGCELTLDIDGLPSHLVLLAESRTGYGNIASLITRGRMDNPRGEPRVSLDTLAAHTDGIFALTGCPRGWIPSRIAAGDVDGACEAAATLLDLFEGRLAIEVWDHHLPEERALVRHLIPLAKSLGIPWVVTNDVHYALPTGRVVHDVLSALRHERTLDTMGQRLRPNGEWYLKGRQQLQRRWRGDDAGLRASLAIAERCTFRLEDLRPTLPTFPLPPGVSADEYLARLVEQGIRERWGEQCTDKHRAQVAHELDTIRRLGLAGYFLIVWDIVRFAHRTGVLCQGRGSAANSAVCYCLGITAVDPIRLELLFERFLSDERQEAPDIDIDFAHRDREQVLQYVYARYGREHAAMVCEQITYRGRSAVRDAARVLGFSVQQADVLSALSDRFSAKATAEALRGGAAPADMLAREYDLDPQSDRPGIPDDPRRQRDEWSAERLLAERMGQGMVRGTEATTRMREEKAAHRRGLGGEGREERDGRRESLPQRRLGGDGSAPERSAGEDARGNARGDARGDARENAHRLAREAAARSGRPELAKRRKHEWDSGGRTRVGDSGTNDSGTNDSGAGNAGDQADGGAPLDAASARPGGARHSKGYEPFGNANAQVTLQQNTRNQSLVDRLEAEGRSLGTSRDTAADPASPLASTIFAQAGLDPNDRRVHVLPDIVEGLHQAPRHRSIHVGGFVLTAEPLRTVVPIEPASMPNRTVIQWERDDLDPVGLVKIDLLGLGMLTVLQDCLKYIRAARGVTLDLGQLDMTDQAVYDDLCAADTIGVFQVESRAQMNTLPRLKPRCFYDLVVEVALIRPGPIQGEMVHPYLRRRAGEEPVTYPHPAVEPILKRTLGIPLFQEQGMQVAIAAAGFTPGEADILRRAMGHKRSRERMAAICEKLITGMARNGIPEDVARRIYNQINAFADYGFPESHSASFALIVYASAYLRHYYAPEFTAAILNAQPMGFYSVGTLIEDAKRHGVEVRPVDLTRSAWDHALELRNGKVVVPVGVEVAIRVRQDGTPDGTLDDRHADRPDERRDRRQATRDGSAAPAVRLGLRLVHGLGAAAREKLERALEQGPFHDIPDVIQRAGLDQRALRALAEAGAFDTMVPDVPPAERRRVALWRVLEALRGDAGPLAPSRPRPTRPPLPAMSRLETTDADYRLTGLSLNGHPMRHLRKLLHPNGVRTSRELQQHGRDGERVAHAGLVICRQRPGTAKGFVFLSLEDETGILNVVVTPKRFERQALMISTSPLLLVRGTLQVESNVVNLRGEQFTPLKADAGEAWARSHDFH
ncbi:MAG: PHP domain-containing protein [Gemmatimonadaceae bacterium]|nr:PHP domain-containing protein [Gemmatimonadaceae bacterium]